MERSLSRREASEAVGEHGWRFVLGTLRTSVAVGSLAEAATAGARAVEACGDHADEHLRLDLRPDRIMLTLWTRAAVGVTAQDADLARRISAALQDLGLTTAPATVSPSPSPAPSPAGSAQGGQDAPARRSVQELEIAIDAMDIVAVRPFWKAVLGYVNETNKNGPEDRIVDPWRQGPAVWFQRMTTPRPQRNRIHLDISVPHDEALARIAAALAAGGTVVSADRAPAFWVLADREGNEVCVTTWQGRDP